MKAVIAIVAALASGLAVAGQQRRLEVSPSNQLESRVALVIGNAAYQVGPLRNPVNDARDITRILRQLGFQVIHREDLGKAAMEDAIAEFGDAIRGKTGVALFYYAGHGMQVGGRNYLVPVNANLSRENEVALRTIVLDLVMMQLESLRDRTNIVILDACRNNPFTRSFRSASNGLALMEAPSGTLVAYSTAPGTVASDGPGANGIYTEELLKAMILPSLQIEDVFKRVRAKVQERTRDEQRPWESSSLIGDFYFVQPGATRVPAARKEIPAGKASSSDKSSPTNERSQESLTSRNTSRKIRENLWDWTVFLVADPATVARISCVEYTLHPTFPDPVRTVCTPSNNFALNSSGWGTFEIGIRVMFKDGSQKHLRHQLTFE
jgi:hypothetical protein